MLLNLFRRNALAALAACPGCACDVSVEVMIAWRHAGVQRDKAGVVCECVRCGGRYTVLSTGAVVRYGMGGQAVAAQAGRAQVGTDRMAGGPGGQGTGGGGSFIDDMVTNLADPGF